MFPAKQIMTREVITVHQSTPVDKLLHILIKNKISGLPVVDDEGNLVGLVTEKDLLFLMMDKGGKHKERACDVMTRDVLCFDEETSASDICEVLLKHPIRRVPIVSKGKVVGIVSRRDILVLLVKIRADRAKH